MKLINRTMDLDLTSMGNSLDFRINSSTEIDLLSGFSNFKQSFISSRPLSVKFLGNSFKGQSLSKSAPYVIMLRRLKLL